MEYRTLGRTSGWDEQTVLGASRRRSRARRRAMMFGRGVRDHEESILAIHHALHAGINFVDAADVYS